MTLLAGYLVEKGAQGFLFNLSKIVVVKISETCLETLWKVRFSLQGHKAAILFLVKCTLFTFLNRHDYPTK